MPFLKKCENPTCTHEFPEHYYSDYCSDCATPEYMASLRALWFPESSTEGVPQAETSPPPEFK